MIHAGSRCRGRMRLIMVTPRGLSSERESNAVLNGDRAKISVLVCSDFEHKCFHISFEVSSSLREDQNAPTGRTPPNGQATPANCWRRSEAREPLRSSITSSGKRQTDRKGPDRTADSYPSPDRHRRGRQRQSTPSTSPLRCSSLPKIKRC